jgi:hypothetical protein
MAGLRRICKMYGGIVIQGKRWVWDYARDIPVLESEMTKEQLRESERAKWSQIQSQPKEQSGREPDANETRSDFSANTSNRQVNLEEHNPKS